MNLLKENWKTSQKNIGNFEEKSNLFRSLEDFGTAKIDREALAWWGLELHYLVL